ncbi:MAG: hypothetical protein ACOCVM_01435 [Desulfovibrionaceae bacterium]
MNPDEVLSEIHSAYRSAKDSLKIADRVQRRVLQGEELGSLIRGTSLPGEKSEVAADKLTRARQEIDDLFIVAIWAAFESALRTFFQSKCVCLKKLAPQDISKNLEEHVIKEIEYWKMDEVLDLLKSNGFIDPMVIGNAKQVKHYRDWIAHGKRKDAPTQAAPDTAYRLLSEILTILDNHEA